MKKSLHIRPGAARSSRAGFSLAELMVVIVILGLLATVVVPNVVQYLGRANTTVAKSDVVAIADAVTNWQIQNAGRLPESLELLSQPDDDGNSYLDEIPLDPWGSEYAYEPDYDGSGKFRVLSYGADGEPGGEGEDADIDNRSAKSRRGRN